MVHRKAWAVINRKEKKYRQHVGLWRETCTVPEGGHESIYAGVPPYRPAAAVGVLPIGGRGRRAADRLAHGSSATWASGA